VSLGRYVRGLHAGELKKEVVKWLKGVNQNSDLVAHDFSFDETSGRASSFAEGLQLVASVYASDEPVLASTLARIHNLEIDEVKTILSRLISMAYIGKKATTSYPWESPMTWSPTPIRPTPRTNFKAPTTY
jgi:hypothetical protein